MWILSIGGGSNCLPFPWCGLLIDYVSSTFIDSSMKLVLWEQPRSQLAEDPLVIFSLSETALSPWLYM